MSVYRQRTLGRLGAPGPQVMQPYNQPPSVGGINSLDSIAAMPPEDCIYAHNLMPSEYGLRLRKGFREWARGLPSAVKSIIPFEGQFADSSTDRLWAVCAEGIFNVTDFGETDPDHDVVFSVNVTGEAGYGVFTEFTTDDATRYLYFADGENGLHQYSEGTGLWTIPSFVGNTTGFDVADVAYVFSWKNRMWFIQNDSGDGWYTGLNAVGGTVDKFTFGSKFNHGGELKSLYSWTIDGGDGVDDYLVAISRGGDVLVYRGADPTLADFGLVGAFYIGEVPESRRLAVNYGGELYILSIYGLTSIRDLLQGVLPSDAGKSPSAKISRFLRGRVQAEKDAFTWQLVINPADGFLQIITPFDEGKDAIQFSQNLLTRAWGRWRGVGINCAESWNADYYLGSIFNSVWIYDGTLDGTTIDGGELWVDDTQTLGDGWTEPLALTYACDGTQLVQTELTIETGVSAVDQTVYDVEYTVTGYVAGEHAVGYGSPSGLSPFLSGAGTFTTSLTTNGTGSLARVVGDFEFEGTITLVSLKEAAVQGQPIEFDILTSFQAPNGDHSMFKRVGFIRTLGFLAGTAALNEKAIYDYSLEDKVNPPAQNPTQGVNLWDQGKWDVDLWDFGQEGVSFPVGALGIGRVVAIGMTGSSSTRLNLVGWDVTYTMGGFL